MENGLGHRNGSEILFHVVNPDEGSSLHHAEDRRHHGSLHALGSRKIQGQANDGFSGSSQKDVYKRQV